MFRNSLDESVKFELLQMARLLYLIEAPLLWEGKNFEEITGSTDLDDISFFLSDAQNNNWEKLSRDYERGDNYSDTGGNMATVYSKVSRDILSRAILPSAILPSAEEKLFDEIKKIPIMHQNNFEKRLSIVLNILNNDILKNTKKENSVQERIVVFELIRSCFESGGLTDLKKILLHEINDFYGLEEEYFNELIDQATKLDKEIKRSINLVLE